MPFEIERKFLVKSNEWKALSNKKSTIEQGYIVSSKESWNIRVRIINDNCSKITLKYPKKGIKKYEFEYNIPLDEGQELMKLTKNKIQKVRHYLKYKNKDWIVDCFKGKNKSLVIAEIEMDSIREKISIPIWCIKEVTHIPELRNAALSKKSISEWPIEKVHSIL